MRLLEPELPENRREFRGWVKWKRRVFASAVFGIVCVGLLAPVRMIPVLSGGVFAILVAGVLFAELKMTLVYRRDLVERRR